MEPRTSGSRSERSLWQRVRYTGKPVYEPRELHASAKGRFRTRGRYAAATVRGTKWTIADRCDGTLTHDLTDSVVVNDFVRHKTIVLHHGQSYLAKATGPKKK